MQVMDLSLSGLKLVIPHLFRDDRGFFLENFHLNSYAKQGIETPFVQDNLAFSKKGTLRGLHYQESPGQAKLVSCLQGKILDVAVDIRPASITFGKWISIELDDTKHEQIFIPVGFAHGYCVISETALVHYKVSSFYEEGMEKSIRWNDPDLNIVWPSLHPTLSLRDSASPFFKEIFD